MQYGTATNELNGRNPSMSVLAATKLIQVIQQLYVEISNDDHATTA
jgi:hypothetical protein